MARAINQLLLIRTGLQGSDPQCTDDQDAAAALGMSWVVGLVADSGLRCPRDEHNAPPPS